MVEDDPFYWTDSHENPSKPVVDELVKAGAEYKPDNPQFSKNSVTHQKSMVIDGKRAVILTGNLGRSSFTTNLDLGAIILNDPKVVSQVQTIFDADWDRTPLPEMEDRGLVVSPENAREQILELFNRAGSSIHILQQGFTDRDILTALKDKAAEGVKVDLLLTDPGVAQSNMQAAAYMAMNGVHVRYLEKPYIHAKAVTIDSEPDAGKNTTSYVGSQNFSMSALDRNRELGYIFKDQTGKIEKIFDDYQPKGYDIPSKQVVTDSQAIGTAIGMAIRLADKSVTLETNLFSDQKMVSALSAAVKRCVKVQVIMPENPFPWDPKYDGNIKTAEALKEKGVDVKFTGGAISAVKGTLLLVDGKEAVMATDNLSGSAFSRNIGFSTLDIDQKEVAELAKAVKSDWEQGDPAKAVASSQDLVVSPQNARKKLGDFMAGASKELNVATERLVDRQMVALLKKKALEGVPVRVVVADRKNMSDYEKKVIEDLRKAGAEVETLGYMPLRGNYIGVDEKGAYIGSHDLTPDSIDKTRAYGAVATNPQVLKIADRKFQELRFIALVDSCEKTAYLEKKALSFPADRLLLEIVFDKAKYGVKVDIAVGNPEAAGVNHEIDSFNEKLREVAKLDPKTDKEKIAEFYDLKFKPDEALAGHAKLVEAMKNLKDGERLVEISRKDPSTIAEDSITLDGKKLKLEGGEATPVEGGLRKAFFGDVDDDNAWNLMADLRGEL
jgi:phosphatidylserine/phosphatidylglycerophosphate/cardiolipin synthase-like enzyme